MIEHDSDDPLSALNGIEAVMLATRSRCRHCAATYKVIPMSGNGWGVEGFHEPGCPEHEDNQPAVEFGPADLPTGPCAICGWTRAACDQRRTEHGQGCCQLCAHGDATGPLLDLAGPL